MRKTINFSVLTLIFCVLLGDILYILDDTLLVKSLTSLSFVLIGLIGLLDALLNNKTEQKKFCFIMFTGLVFAMMGDIVLEVNFIIGALLFAIGHIFYFVAYCKLEKFHLKDLIYGAVVFVPAALLILLAPFFEFPSQMLMWLCVIYAMIISCMMGKSVSNFVKNKCRLNLVLMMGSVLFLFSDLMLLFNVFSDISKVFRYLCLGTYYPAEILLAISLFLTKKSN